MSFSQRLSHTVFLMPSISQRLFHNVLLTTSFSQRLTHNVFPTTSFSRTIRNVFLTFLQRLSHNVILTMLLSHCFIWHSSSQRSPHNNIITHISSTENETFAIFQRPKYRQFSTDRDKTLTRHDFRPLFMRVWNLKALTQLLQTKLACTKCLASEKKFKIDHL